MLQKTSEKEDTFFLADRLVEDLEVELQNVIAAAIEMPFQSE